MNIIKPGVLPKKKIYFGTCIKCKAEVEYDEQETRPGQYGLETIATCPTQKCGMLISVTPKMESN